MKKWWEIKQSIKKYIRGRFAEFYFQYINPDAAWCSLVMWFVNDSPWEEVVNCSGCDYCGRASYGEIPASALRQLIPHSEGKTFSDSIFTSLRKAVEIDDCRAQAYIHAGCFHETSVSEKRRNSN